MARRKVWIMTGAGRGVGPEIAKAALSAANAVVETGRNPDAASKALGDADDPARLQARRHQPPGC